MPKYHFDLVDHVTVADQGGRDLSDDAEAIYFSERLGQHLRALKPELVGKRYAVLVTDENGDEIHRAWLDVERVRKH